MKKSPKTKYFNGFDKANVVTSEMDGISRASNSTLNTTYAD